MTTVTSKRTRKSKKYVFTLVNINSEEIDKKYNISIVSNIFNNEKQPENTTKIAELEDTNSNIDVISFLDETKRLYKCIVSMIDFSSGMDTDDMKYNCFWCRNPFDSKGIGCPIKYISNKAVKKYYSEVSKDNYLIKENITSSKKKMLDSKQGFVFIPLNTNNSMIMIDKKEYYETDGIFCSFNCCKAYIKDNKHNNLYEHSEFLLYKMYNDMMGTKNIMINSAPHWKLLKEYGGNLQISDFRAQFNKIQYRYHGVLHDSDIFKPVGTLFEEKINF